jgi:hypothetical protein
MATKKKKHDDKGKLFIEAILLRLDRQRSTTMWAATFYWKKTRGILYHLPFAICISFKA